MFDERNHYCPMVVAINLMEKIAMAKGNLSACLAVTLPHEGGYSDHPNDPGGATNMGITHKTLADARGVASVTKADVKALSLAEATAIYDRKFWRTINGDALPFGVDLVTFDFGVNSGPSRAARYLQAVLGMKQDGRVGKDTAAAAVMADGKAVIQKLSAKRLSFMQGLAIWGTFKRGWSRRVADVEAKAVAMWLSRGAALAPAARKQLEAEAAKAGKTAASQKNGSAASATAGGGLPLVPGNVDWWFIGAMALALVIAAVLILKARQNADRADAYAAAAAAT